MVTSNFTQRSRSPLKPYPAPKSFSEAADESLARGQEDLFLGQAGELVQTSSPFQSKSLLTRFLRGASHLGRRLALSIASPFAAIFGTGFGLSPAKQTRASELHKDGITGKGVRVAVIDQAFSKFGAGDEDVLGVYHVKDKLFKTGLEETKSQPGREAATGQKNPSFHGNAMSCIITGESLGLTGVAPDAEILAVAVADEKRRLKPEMFLEGLQWVADHHKEQNIKVVSASLSYRFDSEDGRQKAQALVDKLKAEGVTLVAAAGNRGPEPGSLRFPADLDNVVTVGAYSPGLLPTVEDDKVEKYSSRGGAGDRAVDLVSTGGIFTKDDEGVVSLTHGTSNAAPMVAGAIALLSQEFPELSVDEKLNALTSTARPITGDHKAEGHGVMRLDKAYQLIQNR